MMDIRIKRHCWFILLFVLSTSSLLYFFGNTIIIPYTTDANYQQKIGQTTFENSIDLFDDTIIHEIQINLSMEEYESLIETYEQTSLKEYYKTDVIIDGVTIEDVGVRLKGQLTLEQAFRGSESIENMQLPFLIKFDEYVDGQNYQGITELAVRIGSSEALLEEPLALYAHNISGAVVPECSYASVKVSGLEPAYYVICENIEESFLEKNFDDSDGVLYKAGNFIDFSYQGDDQVEYMDDFEQKTQVNEEDFSHLIAFLKFVNESTDEEFEQHLSDWIDVDSLITLMAVDDLIENTDSFSGMNSNYYLYYSSKTGKFTILAWDMNAAFGSLMGQGDIQRGGVFDNLPEMNMTSNASGAMQQPPNMGNMENLTRPDMEMSGMPQGNMGNSTAFPEGMDQPLRPQSMNLSNVPENIGDTPISQGNMSSFGNIPQGMQGFQQNENIEPEDVNRGQMINTNSGGNTLKERFFANENLSARYEERYSEIAETLYCSDLLLEKLDMISDTFTEYNSIHNLMKQEEYDKEVQQMKSYIEARNEEVC